MHTDKHLSTLPILLSLVITSERPLVPCYLVTCNRRSSTVYSSTHATVPQAKGLALLRIPLSGDSLPAFFGALVLFPQTWLSWSGQ
ncbi:hypothetical protein F5X99DRAFT_365746 [Biscogniauxia marginata]|nr:hypothetical protein F5X99DRAFT_365746 [Biscogniauxia marginata]